MSWVVFYDIHTNKARRRVAKKLEQAGIRVQKSVFLLQATPAELKRVVRLIAKEIDTKTDVVAAWQLAPSWQASQQSHPTTAQPLVQSFVIV